MLSRRFISCFHSVRYRSSAVPYFSTSISLRTMSAQSIAVLDASELKDGEMYVHIEFTSLLFLTTWPVHRKEVAFGDGKVLLSKLGDKVYATSAFCTHYGAPLAKGILTADGRVIWSVFLCVISFTSWIHLIYSPWHGGTNRSAIISGTV